MQRIYFRHFIYILRFILSLYDYAGSHLDVMLCIENLLEKLTAKNYLKLNDQNYLEKLTSKNYLKFNGQIFLKFKNSKNNGYRTRSVA